VRKEWREQSNRRLLEQAGLSNLAAHVNDVKLSCGCRRLHSSSTLSPPLSSHLLWLFIDPLKCAPLVYLLWSLRETFSVLLEIAVCFPLRFRLVYGLISLSRFPRLVEPAKRRFFLWEIGDNCNEARTSFENSSRCVFCMRNCGGVLPSIPIICYSSAGRTATAEGGKK
jgi:hypothetical protein